MELVAIVGLLITIFFAGVRLKKLEKERQATMSAEREVLNRKYRLSLITRDEFREKLIELATITDTQVEEQDSMLMMCSIYMT